MSRLNSDRDPNPNARYRSPEFQAYLDNLLIHDPELRRQIVAAEGRYVKARDARLDAEMELYEEQMEGWEDSPAGRLTPKSPSGAGHVQRGPSWAQGKKRPR